TSPRLMSNRTRTMFRSARIISPLSGSRWSPAVSLLAMTTRIRRELRSSMKRWRRNRSEEHTSELQSPCKLVCRLLLEKKNIDSGIPSALAGGAMSKLFGGGQKAASGGIQGDVLPTDNNTVGMGDAGIKSAIQGSNVPNPDEAVPSFVSGAMAKAGKGLFFCK